MTARRSMPISTRLWSLGLLVAAGFCGWALLWPMVNAGPVDTAPAALPTYDMQGMMSTAAPNAADPAWARPLYFNDRRPRVAVVGQAGNAASNPGFDAVLTGIVHAPGLQLATLSPAGGKPTRVKLGDEVEGLAGWRLVGLTSRTATFRNGERIQELRLEARDVAPPPPATVPPAAISPAPGTLRPNEMAPPPSVPGITGQAASVPPVTSSGPVAAPSPANAGQEQQIQAIRRRIEDARRQMKQTTPPEPSR